MISNERRRAPNFLRFIVTGAILGFLVGGFVAIKGGAAPTYDASAQLGYLGVIGAALGGLLAGLLAVLLDRRS